MAIRKFVVVLAAVLTASTTVGGVGAGAQGVGGDLGYLNLTDGADAPSFDPQISTDGSAVVFRSEATNIIPGRTLSPNKMRGYWYSLETGEIKTFGEYGVQELTLTGNGSQVWFTTSANLSPVDTGGLEDIYGFTPGNNSTGTLSDSLDLTYSRLVISDNNKRIGWVQTEPGAQTGEIVAVDLNFFESVNLPDLVDPESFDLSADGSTFVFADNLTPGVSSYQWNPTPPFDDVATAQLFPDFQSVTTPRLAANGQHIVFLDSGIALWNHFLGGPSVTTEIAGGSIADISADGSRVVLVTDTLDGDAIFDQDNVVVWQPENDNALGVTLEANGPSFKASIAADNSTVVFSTEATNLGPDSNGPIRDILINRSDLPAKQASANPNIDTERPSVPGVVIGGVRANGEPSFGWNASTDNVAVDGYNVYLDDRLVAVVPPVKSPSIVFTGLVPGNTYRAHVRAFDAAGNEGWRTGYRFFTTLGAGLDDERPTPPSSAPRFDGSSSLLTWGASSDNVGVETYRIYDAATRTVIAESTINSAELAPGTYRIYVRAVDFAGNLSWRSAIKTIVVPDDGQPPVPDTERPSIPGRIRVLSSLDGPTVDLDWGPSTDNVGVVEYRIHEKANNRVIATATGTSATIEVPVGVREVYVRAVDAAGNQSWRTGYRLVAR